MKGIFHSLVQMDIDPKQFMNYANAALSRCFENTSFINVSYFVINGNTKKISFARAGHAPSLFYSASEKKAYYFKNKGLGLGILRNSGFDKYVQVNEFEFSTNDVLVLYTDGVTEACNENKEQFGANRLLDAVTELANQSPENIQIGVIKKLYDFCAKESLDDDYSLLIVKFK
jgi:serine phosphatase RsbU (regulator of sigma subunit)